MTDNKTIVCIGILAIISFSSCGTPVNQRLTNYHYIINPTGKRMIHELTFGVPNENRDSTLRHYSNGGNTQEELEWTISYVVGTVRNHQAIFDYPHPFLLYNVDDTTFLSWDKYWTQYEDTVVFRPFYWKPGGETFDDNESNWITNHYLLVNDSLLSLMRKDYTMLDKFSDYYDR